MLESIFGNGFCKDDGGVEANENKTEAAAGFFLFYPLQKHKYSASGSVHGRPPGCVLHTVLQYQCTSVISWAFTAQ